jgi:hypothetical protein
MRRMGLGVLLLLLVPLVGRSDGVIVNHQGVVAVNGIRFSGDGLFRFALVRVAGGAYVWTSDGSAVVSPDAPTAAVTLPVINGVYNVRLGMATTTNMTDIPSGVFSQSDDLALRIWFDDNGGHGMHRLTPDLPIDRAPFAVQADSAKRLNIAGTDTAAVFVDGSGNVGIGHTNPSAKLDVVGTTEFNGDVTVHNNLTINDNLTVHDNLIANNNLTIARNLAVNTDTLFVNGLGGKVGIGTTTPEGILEIAGGNDGAAVISGFNTSTLFLKRDEGGFDAALSNQAGAAPFVFYGGGSTTSTDPNSLTELMRVTSSGSVGIGQTDPSAKLDVVGATELNGDVIIGSNSSLTVDTNTLHVNALNNRVGIGTTAPEQRLHVTGTTRINGNLEVRRASDSHNSVDLQVASFPNNYGLVRVRGESGNLVAIMRGNGSASDNGYVGVYNSNSQVKARIEVNSSGQGLVVGDVKNFSMPNPDAPGTDIWYASVEGPEAAAYIRGTAMLENGEAVITLPRHFRAVASEAGTTVQLTPLSADSLGLAAVERTSERIVVRELHNGVGNYEFDWEVKVVRSGFEDYRIIRPVRTSEP